MVRKHIYVLQQVFAYIQRHSKLLFTMRLDFMYSVIAKGSYLVKNTGTVW